MKQAISSHGQFIVASADAPRQAICPFCNGAVVLRHRSRMNNGGTSYYWRHLNNRNRSCKARSNLIQYVPNRAFNPPHEPLHLPSRS